MRTVLKDESLAPLYFSNEILLLLRELCHYENNNLNYTAATTTYNDDDTDDYNIIDADVDNHNYDGIGNPKYNGGSK